MSTSPRRIHLDHFVLTVRDVYLSADWYERVLGMRRHVSEDAQGRSRVALYWTSGAGQWQKINLHTAGSDILPHVTVAAPGSADLCFLTDHDGILEHLAECAISCELGPVERTGATGTLSSVYIRDPDGNLIELASNPGNRWEHLNEWDVAHR